MPLLFAFLLVVIPERVAARRARESGVRHANNNDRSPTETLGDDDNGKRQIPECSAPATLRNDGYSALVVIPEVGEYVFPLSSPRVSVGDPLCCVNNNNNSFPTTTFGNDDNGKRQIPDYNTRE